MIFPSYMYRDPAIVAEENEMRELGCRLCQSASVTMMRVFCGHARNERQKGFPDIGHRCRWFVERADVLEDAR